MWWWRRPCWAFDPDIIRFLRHSCCFDSLLRAVEMGRFFPYLSIPGCRLFDQYLAFNPSFAPCSGRSYAKHADTISGKFSSDPHHS
jgi:hypothetical protein